MATSVKKIALGSVKSQIGHTKAAAGVAGMIKTALALHHKVLPPTINVAKPNPKYGLHESPLYINVEARPWLANGHPRRAGVSSFGFGGTNFHFVLEEHTRDHNAGYRLHNTADTVFVHAATPESLANSISSIINELQGDDADAAYLNLIAESRKASPAPSDARLGLAANSREDAVSKLTAAQSLLNKQSGAEEWRHPKGAYYRRSAMTVDGSVVALFSGQGAQYLNMGRELALNFPEIRSSFSRIDALFVKDGKRPLSEIVYPAPAFSDEHRESQSSELTLTQHAQPAIGALSAGLYQTLKAAGFSPDFVAGHSFGELTALWAAGVLNDDDFYMLMKARGQSMAPPDDPNFDAGTMIAVMGDLQNLEADIASMSGVYMANINSPKQIVLAGEKAALENAKQALAAKGYNVASLPVSAAFHTELVSHASEPFANAISEANLTRRLFPFMQTRPARVTPKRQVRFRIRSQAKCCNRFSSARKSKISTMPGGGFLSNLVPVAF